MIFHLCAAPQLKEYRTAQRNIGLEEMCFVTSERAKYYTDDNDHA
jgi:hypothetical protein